MQSSSSPFGITVLATGGNTPNWEWNAPSLQDERDFYTNVMGWTITANADSFTDLGSGGYPWNASSTYGFGNVHGDTEGDILWAWDQQFKRYGTVDVGNGSTTADWRSDLLAYYIANLLTELDTDDGDGAPSGFGYDHMYGQGLAVIYNDTADASILPVLTGLRTRLEGRSQYQDLAAGTPVAMSFWLGRGTARWAIVAAYAAQATNDPAWLQVRDNLAYGFETSTDWETGGSIAAGGSYFASRAQSSFDSSSGGTAAYDAGRRYNSTFSLGLAVEAVWRLFVQTGSVTLRQRLIQMAQYIGHYAHDPTWVGPNVGGRFGHNGDGTRFHTSGGPSGSEDVASADCSYDISLVNAMVIGYKLTGDTAMLDQARRFFARGNRWDPGVPTTMWASSTNHVHKFVDTQCDPSRSEFQFNKGQLQYCYMIFENGGQPQVLT